MSLEKQLNINNYNYIQKEKLNNNSWFIFKNGNILNESSIDILIHQANCFHLMNAGIAKQIKEKYPNIAIADKNTKYGDQSKLGSFSSSLEKNNNKDLIILNLYAQYKPGKYDENLSSIDSKEKRLYYLKECLLSLADFIQLHQMDNNNNIHQIIIGVPWLIGCGIAGNDYNITFELFKNIFYPIKKYVKILFVNLEK